MKNPSPHHPSHPIATIAPINNLIPKKIFVNTTLCPSILQQHSIEAHYHKPKQRFSSSIISVHFGSNYS
ncbi:MAG: hypothetical protein ACI90V_007708, partial [Bacillariaceae sp.]